MVQNEIEMMMMMMDILDFALNFDEWLNRSSFASNSSHLVG